MNLSVIKLIQNVGKSHVIFGIVGESNKTVAQVHHLIFHHIDANSLGFGFAAWTARKETFLDFLTRMAGCRNIYLLTHVKLAADVAQNRVALSHLDVTVDVIWQLQNDNASYIHYLKKSNIS